MKYSLYFLQKITLVLSIFFVSLTLIFEFYYWKNKSFPEWKNNIVFSLDVSQSMNVQDVWDFSRLDTGKRKIIDIVQQNPWNNYALNIFAGESLRILPFTTDVQLISTFLLGIDSRNLTKQGSDMTSALLASSESFNEFQSGKVILISDGTDENINISRDIRNTYREKALEIVVIWVGTVEWGYIPSQSPLSPYKIYNWERVISSLNQQSLESIAQQLSGSYMKVGDFNDYSILWETRKIGYFPYMFLLFTFFWLVYLSLLYRSIFIKNKIW